jgi:hypothetical protein
VERGRSDGQIEATVIELGSFQGRTDDLQIVTPMGVAEEARQRRIRLDRHHSGTGGQQMPGDDPSARSDLEDLDARHQAAPFTEVVIDEGGVIRTPSLVASRIESEEVASLALLDHIVRLTHPAIVTTNRSRWGVEESIGPRRCRL